MPIIKPSPFLTGLDFYNPKPGIYRARLHEVNRSTSAAGKLIMRWDWKILSYPDKNNNYYGFRIYPLKNPGYLSMTLRSWLGYGWKDLGAQEPDGQPRPERLIGQEADIEAVHQDTFGFANVDGVWPPGRHVLQAEDGTYSLHPETQKEYEMHMQLRSAGS